uniref:Serine/threonine/tyrosine interacting like 1 n=1 Tax=Nothoprocta perdicaria TaxID=30464 RepID=A0A8C6ZKA5_NOTPE
MAGLRLCEPTELYNILNQYARLCRLAEPNYLCLLDARTQREFDESHIITARKIEQPYPVEILPAKLYMGNFKQACDPKILKDLKIKAQVNISKQPTALFAEDKLLHISVADSPDADLFSHFSTISVLVFSNLGISRSSTVIMAYLMHSSQFTLKEAWEYVRKCKTNMRPNRGFVKQLSDWETRIYGITITDISEPNY